MGTALPASRKPLPNSATHKLLNAPADRRRRRQARILALCQAIAYEPLSFDCGLSFLPRRSPRRSQATVARERRGLP